jgi:hypothetical protein
MNGDMYDWSRVKKPLTAEGKRKWIKALRSGKFRKGRGQLRNQHSKGYCCLGVANEVFNLGVNDGMCFLSRTGDGILFIPYGLQAELARVNDHTAGFDEVIKLIEAIEVPS